MPAAIAPFAVRLYFMSARVLRRADGHNLPCRMFVKYAYFSVSLHLEYENEQKPYLAACYRRRACASGL